MASWVCGALFFQLLETHLKFRSATVVGLIGGLASITSAYSDGKFSSLNKISILSLAFLAVSFVFSFTFQILELFMTLT